MSDPSSMGAPSPGLPPNALRCAAAGSTRAKTRDAVQEACDQSLAALGAQPNVAFVFATPPHAPRLAEAAEMICATIGCEQLLGCTGESLVINDREIEGEAALSLWLGHLPGAELASMHLRFERTPEGGSFTGWPESLEPWPDEAGLILLGDPYSFPADALLERLNEDSPGLPIFGGMASGGTMPGECQLVLGPRVYAEGAVALRVQGDVRLRGVVSQGCKPIGHPMVITKAERNVLLELGGKPALVQLGTLLPELSPRDQQLVRSGLHVGRVVSEYRDQFRRGDFLLRNVIGADPNLGAIVVGDYFRVGQTVQFHIRDDRSADEDLQSLLLAAQVSGPMPVGGLLFTCNGRGTRLFTEPDHDAAAVRNAWPRLPLAGFFAAGEIGPVGQGNYLHGFTASLALFEAAS